MPFRCVLFGVTALFLTVLTSPLSAKVLSIGHRGNSLFAPENTLASFQAAWGKADFIETDVHVSSDGKLVIMHDGTVNRTTDGTGTIVSKTLAQLKQLDAGSWYSTNFAGQRIPTFEEMVTNILPHATPLIEQKAGPASAYVAELARLGFTTNVILQSFDWNFLAGVHALDPRIRLCALGSGTLDSSTLNTVINAGVEAVAWEKSSVTPDVLVRVHNAGLKLYVWTVDGAEIQNFIKMGVDGIISNDPGRVQSFQENPSDTTTYIGEGLAAYWKMDDGLSDGFSTVVADSKGTNTATLSRADGKSHWETNTAMFGGALSVDGANGSVAIPRTGTLDMNTNEITISAWVRLPNLPSQLSGTFAAIFDSVDDCYVFYLDKSNKELRFKVTDVNGHAARPGIPEAYLKTNQWLHIAATYSARVGPVSGQATIYLNGEPRDVHTGNDNNSPFGLTGNIKPGQIAGIGREGANGGSYFTGSIDDLAIWKRALTPAEIQSIYQRGLSGESLANLMRLPSSRIALAPVRRTSPSSSLEIEFKNLGPWKTFRLLRASNLNGPFLEVPGIAPTALGNESYLFSYPPGTNGAEYFRVEGW